jgi:hypothetical protein
LRSHAHAHHRRHVDTGNTHDIHMSYGSVGIDTAPSGHSQHVLGVVGQGSKGQQIHQKRHIPGCDEMGVELDDGTDGIPLVTRFDEGLS